MASFTYRGVGSGWALDGFGREGGENFTALKVYRSCPLVLVVKMAKFSSYLTENQRPI
jgi:hypothetical protein